MKTQIWVEHDGSAAKDAMLGSVTATGKLCEVYLLVAGENVGGVTEVASKIAGDQFHALIDSVADKLGAGVGASRVAVGASYGTNDHQGDQAGKIAAPDDYVAVSISGAVQHLAGMDNSKITLTINKDDDMPIGQVADIGLACGLFKLDPDLTEKLWAGRNAL